MTKRGLHSKLDHVRHLVVNSPVAKVVPPAPERYHRLAEAVGAELVTARAGNFCLVRRCRPPTYSHGQLSLADSIGRAQFPASAFTAGDDDDLIDLADVRCFDLETVGMGGSGTVAFLVGVGSMTGDGFEVRQYLLPDYEDEAALLEAVAAEFDERTVLVSYNGAAFDLPILRDRFIVNRIGREIPRRRHVDLLHAARRLFRRRLSDCSLGNIEREVFGFNRLDDIPGYLVPSVYLDWLSEQRLNDLGRVLEHNHNDILSLHFLAGLIADVFETAGGTLDTVDDLHSLSRIFGRRRLFDRTAELNRRVQVLGGNDLASDVLLFHAQTFKRTGRIEHAVELWKKLARRDCREGFHARLELAVFYEHHRYDYAAALEQTERAGRWSGLTEARRRALARRRERLLGKL